MTTEETKQVLKLFKATYPHYYKNLSAKDAYEMITVWTSMFVNVELRNVLMAVKAYIASNTKGFPPVPGQINSKLQEITQPKKENELDAWNRVVKAISNSAYNSQKEFDKLSPQMQRAVGSSQRLKEYSQMPTDTLNSVVQSNFLRTYKAMSQQEEEYQMLSQDCKNFMLECQERFGLKGLVNRE